MSMATGCIKRTAAQPAPVLPPVMAVCAALDEQADPTPFLRRHQVVRFPRGRTDWVVGNTDEDGVELHRIGSRAYETRWLTWSEAARMLNVQQ